MSAPNEQEPVKLTDNVRVAEATELFKNCVVAHMCRILLGPGNFPEPLDMNKVFAATKTGLAYGNDPKKLRIRIEEVSAGMQEEVYRNVNNAIESIASDDRKVKFVLNRMNDILKIGLAVEEEHLKQQQKEEARAQKKAEKKEKKNREREGNATEVIPSEKSEKSEKEDESSSSELPEVSSSSSSELPKPRGRGKGKGKK